MEYFLNFNLNLIKMIIKFKIYKKSLKIYDTFNVKIRNINLI